MQDAQYYWDRFLTTGAPAAYLDYVRAAKESELSEISASQTGQAAGSACEKQM